MTLYPIQQPYHVFTNLDLVKPYFQLRSAEVALRKSTADVYLIKLSIRKLLLVSRGRGENNQPIHHFDKRVKIGTFIYLDDVFTQNTRTNCSNISVTYLDVLDLVNIHAISAACRNISLLYLPETKEQDSITTKF